ncbi:DEAD/DEAH box helicase [Fusobacterium perfoetens]|uniref:DEAD/DEAH box helicase n=1 Tax=Fusobacterium perfoetens TaxID=852 RepID=UPI0009DD3A21|nr:DEAD/DEAH box helicase [Fusobacterium perfoetens]MCI6153426.1 DEAD/DEAH box helicase [Fusobacterium perfoetens]MDY3238431.1 DEAD/DEAH box helicase [Fusobacterium perfoetens]
MNKLEKFRELGLSDKTLKALSKKGFEEPSPIQALTIPVLLKGEKDVIGQAQTGTGKTAAFALPILEKIEKSTGKIRAIILAPTRELAIQVAEETNSFAFGRNLKVVPVYGGQSIELQIRQVKKGVDIVVGTPGRVLDLIDRKLLKLDEIDYFILDEADEMLNMGFIEDIEKILSYTKADKRMLFFSATMPKEILKIAENHMRPGYEILKVETKELTTNLTDQIYFEVKQKDKFEALCRIIDLEPDFYGIVFCRTKNDVNELAGKLNDRGYDAGELHGDITQNYRETTLKRFKDKKLTILVATDVAARGIDVNDLTHVVNYSVPQEAESYVHRIGRTGRAGKEGTAITFITPSEYKRLLQIKRITKTDIRKEKIPGIKDVIISRKYRIKESVKNEIQEGNINNFVEMAKDLLKEGTPEEIIASLLKINYEDVLDSSNYNEIEEATVDKTGKTRLFIALGRVDKITPKKIVDLIAKESKIDRDKIKNVEVYENFSFMNVPFAEAEYILDIFKKQKKGRKPLVEKAKVKSNEEEKVEEVTPKKRGRKPKSEVEEKKTNKKNSSKESVSSDKTKKTRKKKAEGSTKK